MAYKLFGTPLSPFVSVATIVLELLGADYEHLPVRPHNDDPVFIKASPLGKVPALADGDIYVADSTAIAVYADAKANGSLFGSDPESKAHIAFFEKYIQNDGTTISSKYFAQKFKNPDDAEGLAVAQKNALQTLEFLNAQVQDNGHFVGSSYTIADVAVFSHLVAYQLFETLDASQFPKLSSFFKKASENPAFSKAAEASKAAAAQFFGSK